VLRITSEITSSWHGVSCGLILMYFHQHPNELLLANKLEPNVPLLAYPC